MTPAREVPGGKVFDRISATGVAEEYTKAAFLGERAASFIARNRDNPFILYVNFLEPHPPFNGPFNDLHDRNDLNTGPAFLKQPAPNTSLLHRMMAEHYSQAEELGFDLTKEASWRELRARYFGLVTLMDKAVGRIMKALDDSGQADNTVVVFTSEHGDMMGDHNILHKTVLYEEAMKVPLLIRVPWLSKQGKTVPGRVGLVDLAPTLLTLLGANVPGHLQGRSLTPVMAGSSTLAGNAVFVQWNGTNGRKWSKDFHPSVPAATVAAVAGMPWRTIVSHDGWKLNLASGDQRELYDLNGDPHEMVNRFDDPTQGERVRDLAGRIRRWQEETGDVTPVHPAGL